MAKDLKAGMGKGLGSLVQPTTSNEQKAEEPQPRNGQEETKQQQFVVVGAKKKAGRPSKAKADEEQKKANSVTMGLRQGYTRATIICNIETLAKVREIAYLERTPVMDVVEQALAELVEKYEAKHGEVVPPKNKK